MAERILQERLQPSLLDRLTDDAREKTSETGSVWIIDVSRLRQIIQRDLGWLLNTSNLEATHDLEAYPNVANSVLNYGVVDISGSVATADRAVEIRQAIRTAIENFEPRLLPETLEVEMRQERVGSGAVISFDIRAELWAEPVPVDLYLRTALDITTGEVTLKRQG
ncbi:type VI secretion system baseplate subunit TssE [Loktanella sp. D2R18]|uniref:type VI secretion system baseplate subunit TssE n=1 Tax=Rhodobacterales TaxID=204455 RepID=UPI000DEB25ED|nr:MULTISPECIES: type VI secretion system baseplate subunit TssE [Rhodobacterales]MDO6590543.1 type VI secretion system baseplate subunit TssE [Yoonia sp. 1_MG-2023]RBW41260.1 type VI secretion system baseplate subunit TssE [Loktanella sp. D2R18]